MECSMAQSSRRLALRHCGCSACFYDVLGLEPSVHETLVLSVTHIGEFHVGTHTESVGLIRTDPTVCASGMVESDPVLIEIAEPRVQKRLICRPVHRRKECHGRMLLSVQLPDS